MANYCPQCGKKLTKNANFCSNCGMQIDVATYEPVNNDDSNELTIDDVVAYADNAYKNQDFDTALKYYEAAAKAGSAYAMGCIADMYKYGEGVMQNNKKAFQWDLKAANAANRRAMYNVGCAYYNGNGIKKDKKVALEWWHKAATSEIKDKDDLDEAIYVVDKLINYYKFGTKADEYFELKKKLQKQKDGCFITTAVCYNLGKADDCYELTVFRNFRDNWLAKQINGNNLIKQYYLIAPVIVANINKLVNAVEIYNNIWNNYLQPCLKLIEQGKLTECRDKYVEMVNNLKLKYL